MKSGSLGYELGRALGWYDTYFLVYNLFLALFAVAIVPLITYFYVRTMKEEKIRRLRRDLGDKWEDCKDEVMSLIRQQFRFRNYLGSLLAVMLVIATGVFPILLLKASFPGAEAPAAAVDPAAKPEDKADSGLNYGLGANLLLLGPLVELSGEISGDPAKRQEYYHQIVIGLTAFEFGFLGAYIYFISQLLRSYFTLDLSPHTHVAGAIRMTTSSVLALVLSFVLPGTLAAIPGVGEGLMALPVIAFFLGYFPNRALLWLQIMGNKFLGLGREDYSGTALARLTGMSSSNEVRLEREGFDNLETLSHADSIQLAVRTGLSYRQLKYWISEARLRVQLGEDYDELVRRTWIHTEEQLREFYANAGDERTATERLAHAFVDSTVESKLAVEYLLLEDSIEKSRRPAPAPGSP
jgi:hypothetical protein